MFQDVFHLIDLRSFSNIWYWIVVAAMWSSLSHFVLGVPFDMVARAHRQGGAAQADLEAMVRVQVNRRLYLSEAAGPWVVGLITGGLAALATLGFGYGLQLGQAAFLLLAPAALTGLLGVLAARRIREADPRGEALCAILARERRKVQALGVVSILLTAFWGMWQAMSFSVLGS